ncbi:glycosyltransferase [Klenkia sp. LSe6-5]|uniref:Glycosyltransferase n=1 Tax=Klenkia sesuvii TaxID=3103137 RepID=A0ABU8DTQ3_9ACTN
MSTYLLCSTPLYGHVVPLVTIGRRLVEHGHRVLLLTGSVFADRVRAAGLEFRPLRGAADFDERDPGTYVPDLDRYRGLRLSRYQVEQTFVRPIPDQFRAVRAILDAEGVDAVLVDCVFAGILPLLTAAPGTRPPVLAAGIMPLAQTSRDVAPYNTALPPSSTRLGRLRNRTLNAVGRRVLFAPTQRLADQLVRDVGGTGLGDSFVMDLSRLFDRFLQLGPAEFEYPRSDLSPNLRFVGPVLPGHGGASLPDWWSELDDGRPVVHVTQGTLDTDDFTKLVRPTLDALADDDVHVLVSTGRRPVEAVGPTPANARVAEFLPYDALLPRTDVVVTNGGFGGTLQALAAGVPLVVAGAAEDKPETAARVAHFGLGIDLRTGRPSAERVRRAVHDVLADPSWRARTTALAATMAGYDALDAVVDELERAVAARREAGGRRAG